MHIDTIVQAGGVLSFAAMVYVQLREQTKILAKMSANMVRMLERQDTIIDRQKLISVDLHAAGLMPKVLGNSE